MFYIVDIGLDGMKSAMANIGLKMIMQKGDIVMASQVMEMDTVEGMLIVKQKNFFCSVGHSRILELYSLYIKCNIKLTVWQWCWVPESRGIG